MNTREFILQTSLLLFMQKSYKDVTMKEIVNKTGLSKGAFYHYFNSKEALFKEVVNMLFAMGDQKYENFPKDSLLNFYTQYLTDNEVSFAKMNQFFNQSGDGKMNFNFFFIMFEAMNRFPEYLKMEETHYQSALQSWTQIIDIAKQKGEIDSPSNSRQIADLFLYVTDGAFIRYLNHSEYEGSYTNYLKDAFDGIYANLKT